MSSTSRETDDSPQPDQDPVSQEATSSALFPRTPVRPFEMLTIEGTPTDKDESPCSSAPMSIRKRDRKKAANEAAASRMAARRLAESQEEREDRLQKLSERAAENKQLETDREKKNRKRLDAERAQERLSQAPEDALEVKRQKNAELMAESRNNVSNEVSESMRLLNAAQVRLRRHFDPEPIRATRRAADAARAGIRRSLESAGDREKRQRLDASRKSEVRAQATPEGAADRRAADRARKSARTLTHLGIAGLGGPVQRHYFGPMNRCCTKCGAKYFSDECNEDGTYTKCCRHGFVKVPLFEDFPPILRQMFEGTDADSKHFKIFIRNYNSALATGSFKANVEDLKGGAYTFRCHGQSYHFTGPLHPEPNQPRQFAQVFILDTEVAAEELCGRQVNSGCTEEMFTLLMDLLKKVNPFVKSFKTMYDVELEERAQAKAEGRAERAVKMTFRVNAGDDPNRYQLPTSSEVAVIYVGDEEAIPGERTITIHQKNGRLQTLKGIDRECDPMVYPLLFPTGQYGWHPNIEYTRPKGKRERVSTKEFYSFLLHVRDNFSPLFLAGKLFQQFIVDVWCKIEQNRLDWIRFNQDKLRVDSFRGLQDYVAGEEQGSVGSRILLPSTHPGSPRHMVSQYQDAMAVVTRFGKPDYFVTMTCSPKWREIEENLLPGQSASDRPDLVARVFNLKMHELKDDIMKRDIFGMAASYIFVVEFQKRGLPHVHMLIIMKTGSKPRTADDVDRVICAELPDQQKDPELFELVSTTMMHRPCGAANPNSPCMQKKKGSCDKGFPKPFREETSLDVDGFPLYRRRDDGRSVHHKLGDMDNRRVVPYNPFVLKKYGCHINVEVVGTVSAVKYLYKYVYKGHTRLQVRIFTDADGNEREVKDEINNYLDTRYVCPPEAAHHLYGFPMLGRNVAVIHLKVHLPGDQGVIFNAGEEPGALEEARLRKTTLTAWFEHNKKCEDIEIEKGSLPNEMIDSRQFHYYEMPDNFTFTTRWMPRKKKSLTIGRMFFVSPRDRERFALRQLLLYVKGATGYDDLLTVNGTKYPTFVEAAREAGFLTDDLALEKTLDDAVTFATPRVIRGVFAILLCNYEVADAEALWNKYVDKMCEDYEYQKIPRARAEAMAYYDIHGRMDAMREDLRKWLDLPYVPVDVSQPVDFAQCEQEGVQMRNQLTGEQESVVEKVLGFLNSGVGGCLFVDGPGGSGKTFVYTCLSNIVQGQRKKVLSVAWTGIAASLLPNGQTVSSAFKLNVPNGCKTSSLKPQSLAGKAMAEIDMLLWDEAPMSPKAALETVDQFLRDLRKSTLPFGGITVVLGGDFRQTLPVVDHGGPSEQRNNSIKRSALWREFTTLHLTANMRLTATEAEWKPELLAIGDGLRGDSVTGEMEVPPEMASNGDLATEIFGELLARKAGAEELSKVAILAPRNKEALQINECVLNMMDTPARTYLSLDLRVVDDSSGSDVDANNFTTEYINKMTPSGMPPHELKLKRGCIVMLLRNLDVKNSLCNGTRLRVEGLYDWNLACTFVTGPRKGEEVSIPKLKLYYEKNLPFKMSRLQFPVRLAFAMTINKSQGQTFDRIGLHVEEKVFSHGQLYVALSRTRTKEGIRIYSPTRKMNNIVFRDIL